MHYESTSQAEDRYLEMLDELRGSSAIEVFSDVVEIDDEENNSLGASMEQRAAEARRLTTEMSKWDGVTIDPQITENGLRCFEIGSHWRTTGTPQRINGEFRLPTFFDAIFTAPPSLAWSGSTEAEKTLFAEFRTIDSKPHSGTGVVATVRIRRDCAPLEIWVWDPRIGAKQMDLDYSGYLAALTLTKGTSGWQYLFTDCSFSDPLLQNAASSVNRMLVAFPQIFPDHDYTPLLQRLEERS